MTSGEIVRPENIDPDQWAVFQKGMKKIDFNTMRNMVPLDASMRVLIFL